MEGRKNVVTVELNDDLRDKVSMIIVRMKQTLHPHYRLIKSRRSSVIVARMILHWFYNLVNIWTMPLILQLLN